MRLSSSWSVCGNVCVWVAICAALHGAAAQLAEPTAPLAVAAGSEAFCCFGSNRAGVSGMAVMFGQPDWIVDPGTNTSDCIAQVDRIAANMGTPGASAKSNRIKFSPYFFYFWAPLPPDDKNYRHNVTQWRVRQYPGYDFAEPTPVHVQQYITDFSKCLAHAISLGFTNLFVNPMIDADYGAPDCCPWRCV